MASASSRMAVHVRRSTPYGGPFGIGRVEDGGEAGHPVGVHPVGLQAVGGQEQLGELFGGVAVVAVVGGEFVGVLDGVEDRFDELLVGGPHDEHGVLPAMGDPRNDEPFGHRSSVRPRPRLEVVLGLLDVGVVGEQHRDRRDRPVLGLDRFEHGVGSRFVLDVDHQFGAHPSVRDLGFGHRLGGERLELHGPALEFVDHLELFGQAQGIVGIACVHERHPTRRAGGGPGRVLGPAGRAQQEHGTGR